MSGCAIVTKFLGPTNTRGARIKATMGADSVTVGYPHEVRIGEDAHRVAADALIKKLAELCPPVAEFKWVGGYLHDGSYVFVQVKN